MMVEGLKYSTLRWFGHRERMSENEMIMTVYVSMTEVVGARIRGQCVREERKEKGRLQACMEEVQGQAQMETSVVSVIFS